MACFPTPPLCDAPLTTWGIRQNIWVKLIPQKLKWYGENFGRPHVACYAYRAICCRALKMQGGMGQCASRQRDRSNAVEMTDLLL